MAIHRIVVGVDGSPASAQALDWAADLTTATAAELLVVHAFELTPYLTGAPLGVPHITPPGDLADSLLAEVDGSWCASLRARGVTYRPVLREGGAGAELLKVAAEEHADLIAVGTRGRNGLREALLGSVAHYVTHHARCPVVVVPPPVSAAVAPAPAPARASAS
jgi:nucleotide-binding universal stress UspA family protein